MEMDIAEVGNSSLWDTLFVKNFVHRQVLSCNCYAILFQDIGSNSAKDSFGSLSGQYTMVRFEFGRVFHFTSL